MAHFLGSVQGSRGAVTRLGGAESGIRASVQTWNEGLRVHLWVAKDGKTTLAAIYRTGGSNGLTSEQLIYSGPLAELAVQS
jgi:hypothetical protein